MQIYLQKYTILDNPDATFSHLTRLLCIIPSLQHDKHKNTLYRKLIWFCLDESVGAFFMAKNSQSPLMRLPCHKTARTTPQKIQVRAFVGLVDVV